MNEVIDPTKISSIQRDFIALKLFPIGLTKTKVSSSKELHLTLGSIFYKTFLKNRTINIQRVYSIAYTKLDVCQIVPNNHPWKKKKTPENIPIIISLIYYYRTTCDR